MGKKDKFKNLPLNGQKTAAGRDARTGRFVKGNRGGGRKAIPEGIKTLLQAAVPEACRVLVGYIHDPTIRADIRLECIKVLLDRVYGKPVQGVDLDTRNLQPVVFVDSDELAD